MSAIWALYHFDQANFLLDGYWEKQRVKLIMLLNRIHDANQ